MDNQKMLARIQEMEALMDAQAERVAHLKSVLAEFNDKRSAYQTLSAYYDSEQYRHDMAVDRAGQLPHDLKRGVLSEDGLYFLFGDHYQLGIELLETALFLLRNE